MDSRVDFDKSVVEERLKFRHTLEGIFSRIADYFFALILPVSSILAITNKRNFEHDTSVSFFFTFIFVLISIWCLLGLFLMNKLVKIEGNNLEFNRKRIIEILTKEFPKNNFNLSGERIIISRASSGLFSWCKIITILFYNENVYLNITTLGRFDIRSAFHAVTNFRRCKKIAKEFQNI